MTARWISDGHQRASKKYKAVVRELEGGDLAPHLGPVKPAPIRATYSYTPASDKTDRKRLRSMSFRATGKYEKRHLL